MDRVTSIEIGGAAVEIMGDPHLGRPFVNGVALEKRGLREKSVWADFEASLKRAGGKDFHVCVGDLFDKWHVSFGVIWNAAMQYLGAAHTYPSTTFIVMGGNHDIAKDLEKKGALDLFELIVARAPNIKVVRHEAFYTTIGKANVGFFPWHPTTPADELVTQDINVAFGHWDTVFGHDNMIPTEKLAQAGCTVAFTGHVHLPDEFKRDGVEVVQVGSLQPFAHGEDDGEVYVTLRPEEIEGQDLRDKAVRILLEPGQIFDEQVDCLQLTFKRAKGADDDEVEDVSLGEFNMAALMQQAFEEAAVPEAVRNQLISRFEEARVKE